MRQFTEQSAGWETAGCTKVVGSIPGQGTYKKQPRNEGIMEQQTDVSLSLSLKINITISAPLPLLSPVTASGPSHSALTTG